MDIFEFAVQMENDGEQYYRQTAEKTADKGLQAILLMLAEDEQKHAEAIGRMQSETVSIQVTTVLDNAKNIFAQMKEFGGQMNLSGDEEQLYRQAMVLEQRSISFYMDRADEVENAEQKAIFERLAEEERKHYRLLQDIAEFVKRPKNWLENAEFSRFEEY